MPTSIIHSPLATLCVALFLLGLAPNLSVLVVTTRAAASGFKQGFAATLGIVVATGLQILVVILGLMIVADMRPEARHFLRLMAAVYLVWSGMSRIRDAAKAPRVSLPVTTRDAASFATGFLLTLLNLKSLLFYMSLLPVFIPAGALNLHETWNVIGVAAAATAAAKLLYVVASARGAVVPSVGLGKALNVLAGILIAVAGFTLATGRHIGF